MTGTIAKTHRFREMPQEMRPQDPHFDGRGWTFELLEHGGDYPDAMPQAIRATDAQGDLALTFPSGRTAEWWTVSGSSCNARSAGDDRLELAPAHRGRLRCWHSRNGLRALARAEHGDTGRFFDQRVRRFTVLGQQPLSSGARRKTNAPGSGLEQTRSPRRSAGGKRCGARISLTLKA